MVLRRRGGGGRVVLYVQSSDPRLDGLALDLAVAHVPAGPHRLPYDHQVLARCASDATAHAAQPLESSYTVTARARWNIFKKIWIFISDGLYEIDQKSKF